MDSAIVTYDLVPKNGTLISAQLQYCPNCNRDTFPTDSPLLRSIKLFGDGRDTRYDSISQHIDSASGTVYLSGRLSFPNVQATTRDKYRLTYQYKEVIRSKTANGLSSPQVRVTDSAYHALIVNNLDYNVEAPCEGQIGLCGASNHGFPNLAKYRTAVGGYHYRIAGGIMLRNFSLMVSTQGTQAFGRPATFTFYEYGGVFGQWMIMGRSRTSPFVTLGGKYSRVKGADSSYQIVHRGLGGEIGIGLQSDFERLSYTYSTNLGGFHKFDLLLAAGSFPFGSKFGTGFTLYSGKYVRQFQLNMVLSMATEGVGLEKIDRRPKLIRILSSVSLIYVPIVWLISGGE